MASAVSGANGAADGEPARVAVSSRYDVDKAIVNMPEIHDLDPAAYAGWARRWRELGAAIVGGCCGIGCAHIAALRRALKPSGQSS